ncbi:hypothetical protein [Streptomyces tauricus]|uniref:hypothetical protein n=1 Tax=Streptomyces tauricus TaxID=68274 RepID=UPI00341E3E60
MRRSAPAAWRRPEGSPAGVVQPVLQLLERETPVGTPHDKSAVQRGGVRQLHGTGRYFWEGGRYECAAL